MNRKREQLMAAHLAGEDVADELLEACRKTPEVLSELAEHTALERLLTFQADDEDDAVFVSEVRARLVAEADDSFADAVRGRLQPPPRHTHGSPGS